MVAFLQVNPFHEVWYQGIILVNIFTIISSLILGGKDAVSAKVKRDDTDDGRTNVKKRKDDLEHTLAVQKEEILQLRNNVAELQQKLKVNKENFCELEKASQTVEKGKNELEHALAVQKEDNLQLRKHVAELELKIQDTKEISDEMAKLKTSVGEIKASQTAFKDGFKEGFLIGFQAGQKK